MSTLNSHKSDYTHTSAMVVFNSHTIVGKVQENENSFCTNLNCHADHCKQRVSFSFNTCSIELYLFNLFGQSISPTPNIHLPIKAESIELFIAHSFVPWSHYIDWNTLCPNNRKQIALPIFSFSFHYITINSYIVIILCYSTRNHRIYEYNSIGALKYCICLLMYLEFK